MVNNILVTGGCGFIGSNYCVTSIDKFDKMVIIDRVSYCSNIKNIKEIEHNTKLVLIDKDILDLDMCKILIEHNINIVLHFAAQTHVDNSYTMFPDFIRDNIKVTYSLLEAINKYSKVDRVIMMSTDEVYGPSTKIKLDETSNFNPTNPYSASKACAEMIINTYKYSYGMPIITIRCNNVYGPKQYPEKVIPKFIKQILNGTPITVHGTGNKLRDFIYIEDVSNAINIIIKKGTIGEIYNIGIENSFSINQLALYLIDKLNIKADITKTDDRPFNDDRYFINCDKLISLGWNIQNTWEDGITKTIEWIKNNKNYWKDISELQSSITEIHTFDDLRGTMKFITNDNVKEQFVSVNKKNVIRGIHCSPYGKTIICLKGLIIDYIVDIENRTYKKYILTSNSKLYVPPNMGHLFISLEDDSQILYQLEGRFCPENEININYRDPYINLDIPWDIEYIVSEKDNSISFIKPVDYVILGSRGYLGSYTCKVMKDLNKNYVSLDTRLENNKLLIKQLSYLKPKYVICAAGISGKPTVNWCETHKEETYNANYVLQLQLSKICKDLDIHLTIYGSGLIYKNGFYNEKSKPNLTKLYYSRIRKMLEEDLDYSNVLYLRILYPISGDGHEKCFLSKIKTRLNSVHDVKINCTVLPDLLPAMIKLIEADQTGIYNFVNPNTISIPEIINQIYKTSYYNITYTDDTITELDTNKLISFCPTVNNIHDALSALF